MKTLFIFILVCSFTVSSIAQEEKSAFKNKLVPKSLYSQSFFNSTDFLGNYMYNKSLYLDSFDFFKFDVLDGYEGYMTVPIQNFSKISSRHFFDTYQELYHKSFLTKDIFRGFDYRNFNFKDYKKSFAPN